MGGTAKASCEERSKPRMGSMNWEKGYWDAPEESAPGRGNKGTKARWEKQQESLNRSGGWRSYRGEGWHQVR